MKTDRTPASRHCERLALNLNPKLDHGPDLMAHVDVYGKPGRWSLRQRGLVVAWCSELFLIHARFMVSRARFDRLQREGRRGVCAWARGFLAVSAMGLGLEDLQKGRRLPAIVTYDRARGVFRCDNLTRGNPFAVKGADAVAFSSAGCTASYTHKDHDWTAEALRDG